MAGHRDTGLMKTGLCLRPSPSRHCASSCLASLYCWTSFFFSHSRYCSISLSSRYSFISASFSTLTSLIDWSSDPSDLSFSAEPSDQLRLLYSTWLFLISSAMLVLAFSRSHLIHDPSNYYLHCHMTSVETIGLLKSRERLHVGQHDLVLEPDVEPLLHGLPLALALLADVPEVLPGQEPLHVVLHQCPLLAVQLAVVLPEVTLPRDLFRPLEQGHQLGLVVGAVVAVGQPDDCVFVFVGLFEDQPGDVPEGILEALPLLAGEAGLGIGLWLVSAAGGRLGLAPGVAWQQFRGLEQQLCWDCEQRGYFFAHDQQLVPPCYNKYYKYKPAMQQQNSNIPATLLPLKTDQLHHQHYRIPSIMKLINLKEHRPVKHSYINLKTRISNVLALRADNKETTDPQGSGQANMGTAIKMKLKSINENMLTIECEGRSDKFIDKKLPEIGMVSPVEGAYPRRYHYSSLEKCRFVTQNYDTIKKQIIGKIRLRKQSKDVTLEPIDPRNYSRPTPRGGDKENVETAACAYSGRRKAAAAKHKSKRKPQTEPSSDCTQSQATIVGKTSKNNHSQSINSNKSGRYNELSVSQFMEEPEQKISNALLRRFEQYRDCNRSVGSVPDTPNTLQYFEPFSDIDMGIGIGSSK